jgi:hypothetical protein
MMQKYVPPSVCLQALLSKPSSDKERLLVMSARATEKRLLDWRHLVGVQHSTCSRPNMRHMVYVDMM